MGWYCNKYKTITNYSDTLIFHYPCWLCVAPCQVTTDGFATLASTLSVGRGTWLASKQQQSTASFFRKDYDLGCYPFTAIGA